MGIDRIAAKFTKGKGRLEGGKAGKNTLKIMLPLKYLNPTMKTG